MHDKLVQALLDDLPSLAVALALIGCDLLLHLLGHGQGAQPFDQSIPVLVAFFVGGRTVTQTIRSNGGPKPPASG